VNHDTIAETISRSVAVLTSKVTLCAKLLDIIKTHSMRSRLVEVYSQMFFFLRDVMQWYLRSRTSRFFQSFNDAVNQKFEDVVKLIESNIEEMYKESGLGGLAMQREALSIMSGMDSSLLTMHNEMSVISTDIQDVKDELFRQRQQSFKYGSEFDIGSFMRQALLSSFDEVTCKIEGFEFNLSKFSIALMARLKILTFGFRKI
jgi:hypothetical protein